MEGIDHNRRTATVESNAWNWLVEGYKEGLTRGRRGSYYEREEHR